jgi:hypothetical protein
MEISFTAVVRVFAEIDGKSGTPQLVRTEVGLKVSENLQQSAYVDADGCQTELGMLPLTQALVSGLSTAIKFSHNKGWMNEKEHMEFAIAKLWEIMMDPDTTDVTESDLLDNISSK